MNPYSKLQKSTTLQYTSKYFFCSARVEKLFNVVLHWLNNTIIGGLS